MQICIVVGAIRSWSGGGVREAEDNIVTTGYCGVNCEFTYTYVRYYTVQSHDTTTVIAREDNEMDVVLGVSYSDSSAIAARNWRRRNHRNCRVVNRGSLYIDILCFIATPGTAAVIFESPNRRFIKSGDFNDTNWLPSLL